PGRTGLGLHPFIFQQPGVFQACEERVEGTFYHNHFGRGQLIEHVGDVHLSPRNDMQHAVFQDPLPHLHLRIFDIHILISLESKIHLILYTEKYYVWPSTSQKKLEILVMIYQFTLTTPLEWGNFVGCYNKILHLRPFSL